MKTIIKIIAGVLLGSITIIIVYGTILRFVKVENIRTIIFYEFAIENNQKEIKKLKIEIDKIKQKLGK